MTIINSNLPEFSVQAYHNDQFKTVSSKDLKGKWAIFFFYPADFTFVCPTELGDLADKYEQLKSMGVEVYSVSTDTHFVHKAWHDASDTIKKIKFPMLADPTGAISRAFGVYIESDGLAYRAFRSSQWIRTPVYPTSCPFRKIGEQTNMSSVCAELQYG